MWKGLKNLLPLTKGKPLIFVSGSYRFSTLNKGIELTRRALSSVLQDFCCGRETISAFYLRIQDNRQQWKEFFLLALFLTFRGPLRRWTREEKGSKRLTTRRTRMSYFDIGTSYPIRSGWRLFWKRGRTIPWQYSDRWSNKISHSPPFSVVMDPRPYALPSILACFLAFPFSRHTFGILENWSRSYRWVLLERSCKRIYWRGQEFHNRKHISINVPFQSNVTIYAENLRCLGWSTRGGSFPRRKGCSGELN